MRLRQALIVAGACFVMMASDRPAAASFDGNWSLVVTTKSGNCDPSYRLAVRIQNGEVRPQGDAGVNISGTVRADGSVTATVQRGPAGATGSGKLTRTSGSGTWTGRGPGQVCNGTWQIQRR